MDLKKRHLWNANVSFSNFHESVVGLPILEAFPLNFSFQVKFLRLSLFLVGKCEKWNIIIVPMLKTEEIDHLGALKNLIETVIGDCKWYYGYMNLQFLTKDLEFIRISDPVDFTDIDHRVILA